ncbi:hypothetical protein MTBSS4_320019 [Magnetospirillum sp. SS-4]|nr:hypothetical protein MTBSS4_320019 [Magnetospirillum sp. SS-4]
MTSSSGCNSRRASSTAPVCDRATAPKMVSLKLLGYCFSPSRAVSCARKFCPSSSRSRAMRSQSSRVRIGPAPVLIGMDSAKIGRAFPMSQTHCLS